MSAVTTEALLNSDLPIAEEVIGNHQRLTRMQTDAEEMAFVLLALQAPVAADLRTVVACLQNVADAERMGGLALHVAKIARRRHPAGTVPEDVKGYFAEMGRIAVELGESAKDVVLSRDSERAAQISRDDEQMDDLHRQLFGLLKEEDWAHGVAAAVDVTLLGQVQGRGVRRRRVILRVSGLSG